jgi:uncharacterized protein YndB with AHSA1/START domain
MPDILFSFPISAPPSKVFLAIATPAGLDKWWTSRSKGEAKEGAVYELWFGPEYDWRPTVSKCIVNSDFEFEMSTADSDWTGTRVGFHLEEKQGSTSVDFYHTGWPILNDHYRRSAYCWAMYLRILCRYLEHGETVGYDDRLNV